MSEPVDVAMLSTKMSKVIALVRRVIGKARRLMLWPFSLVTRLYRDVLGMMFNLVFDDRWLIDRLPISKAESNTILLVRMDLIGDFTLWLDSARAYRDLYPNQKIVLCANSLWSELARQQPWWDEVIAVDINRLRFDRAYCLRLMVRLHWRRFSVAIQPTFSRELAVDRLIRATGAAERIGQEGDANNITPSDKSSTDAWYTKLIKAGDPASMELTKNAEFVRGLGAEDFRSSVGQLWSSGGIRLPVVVTGDPYILISPSTSWAPRAWPAENFARLVDELFAQYGVRVVLCGSPTDYTLCESIAQMTHASVQNLAGQTSLTQLLDLIAGAQLMISNDSGNIHLAAALRVASVCIVGGGNLARFLPYVVENSEGCVLPLIALHRMDCFGCRWRCKYDVQPNAAVPCVANIAVAMVRDMCDSVLMGLSQAPRV